MLRDEADGWLRLGEVAPQLLREMRVQLHWASRIIAAVAAAHFPSTGDGPHDSLEWLTGREMLAGARPWRGRPFRTSLLVADFALALLDLMDRPVEELPLDGRSLDDALNWLENAISEYTGAPPVRLELPPGDMPRHPVAGGRTFRLESSDSCVELARWYASADVVLRELAGPTAGAGPVICAPERLDLRTQITVFTGDQSRPARAVMVGMSPGDSDDPDPYWYVTTVPSIPAIDRPALGHGGEWYPGDACRAVLTARRLLPGSAAGQRERLIAFLEEAIALCREMVA